MISAKQLHQVVKDEQRALDRTTAARELVDETLLKQFGVSSIANAKKLLAKREKALVKNQEQNQSDLEAFEAKWMDHLIDD